MASFFERVLAHLQGLEPEPTEETPPLDLNFLLQDESVYLSLLGLQVLTDINIFRSPPEGTLRSDMKAIDGSPAIDSSHYDFCFSDLYTEIAGLLFEDGQAQLAPQYDFTRIYRRGVALVPPSDPNFLFI